MSVLKYLIMPVGIWIIAAVYWFVSYDAAGSTMLAIFGGAMGVMGVILLPTVSNVGPTAPVDPDFEDPGR